MSYRHNRFLMLTLFIGLLAAGVTVPTPARANWSAPQKKDKKKDKKSKKQTAAPTESGTPRLWEAQEDISKLNLYYGIGSQEEMPKPPFQFDKEDITGTNPKIKVIDANGIKWNIKFDEEVHAEVASSRIVWACGYMVEESYFIPSGTVNGVSGLGRAKKFIGSGGSFTNGMFEKRPDDIARRGINWDWDSNPFRGSKELSGLAILNTLLNNWDAKTTNNNVLGMYDDDGKVVDWHLVADWGGSFGKMGGFTSHTKWDLNEYNKQAFLDGTSGGQLKLHYSGKMGSSLKSVPIEHARWFAGIIGQLSDDQLRDAFRAAGASPNEVEGFSRRLRQKINELKSAVGK
ncbi:MAG TPA: hypothetical protein PLD20_01410 [Blastocatellia bacterium]|nr:hypothetical protein [Blastocatellia bacterium]HMV83313.1 hypothetical protein [Blastocatellia bacterium]HMX24213.1 hypothetical protein [Blastocatellia bacterium]HMY71834.1 hypothetical protein [Blastocatellia bacterium]HMZ16594.1 hypothetical protein [Blastocatellia bacterium]